MTFGHCEVACFNTTTTISTRLLLHDLVSSTTPSKENQRHNFLFENTRESQQKKKDPDLDQLQSRYLFSFLLFSPLSSSSSSLACSNATLLLQATLPPCWEPENGRARSTRAGDQRAGRPSVTDPARHPARWARSVEIRESESAGPGLVGLL